MLKEFKAFLVEHGVIEEYCQSLKELHEGFGCKVNTLTWCEVFEDAFGWEDSRRVHGTRWDDINRAWQEVYEEHDEYEEYIGFDTAEEFIKALRGKSKKHILLSRIQYVK